MIKSIFTLLVPLILISCSNIKRSINNGKRTISSAPQNYDENHPHEVEKLRGKNYVKRNKSSRNNYLHKAVIYGEDDQKHIYLHPDKKLQEILEKVVALTSKKTLPIKKSFCSGAIYNHNNENFVLTANHCFDHYKCEDVSVVRNFEFDSNHRLRDDQVMYKCKEVVYANATLDIAVFKISQSPDDNFKGLPFEISNNQIGDPLAVIGHPQGKPKMIADNCNIQKFSKFDFVHPCDTFSGNSGSPTINLKDYKLAGPLVFGIKYISRLGDKSYDESSGRQKSVNFTLIKNEIISALEKKSFNSFATRDNSLFVPAKSDINVVIDKDTTQLCNGKTKTEVGQMVSEVLNANPKYNLDSLNILHIKISDANIIEGNYGAKPKYKKNKYIATKSCSNKTQIIEALDKRISYIKYIKSTNITVNGIKLYCNITWKSERCTETINNIKAIIQENNFSQSNTKLESIYIQHTEFWGNKTYTDINIDTTKSEVLEIINNKVAESNIIKKESFFSVNGIKIISLLREKSNDENHEDYLFAQKLHKVLQKNPQLNAESLNINRLYIYKWWKFDAKGTWIDVDRKASEEEILEKLEGTIVDHEAADAQRAI